MAYFDLKENENSILEIQKILRRIDFFENDISPIRLNGVYNEETRQGVKRFQGKYGLPETGIVDFSTWQLLQAVGKALSEATALARAVYILPRDEEYIISPGLQDDVVYVVQHLINVISQEYDSINPVKFTGIYDSETENAIREFQRINLLESNGILDAVTFNRLADEYEKINSYNE